LKSSHKSSRKTAKTSRTTLKSSRTTLKSSRATACALALAVCAALSFAARGARAQQQQTVIITEVGPPAPAVQQTPGPQTTQAASARPARDDGAAKATRGPDSISGRVMGEGGEPLGGVSVYANPRSFAPISRSQHMAVADDDGGFRIRGLEPGIYNINVFVPGYVPEPDPVTGRVGGEYRPGDTATVRLVKGGVITGTATDAQGQPVVALGVRAFRVRDLDGHAAPPSAVYVGNGKTDDRGIYRIFGLQPGIYVVVAGGPNPGFGYVTPYQADPPTFYPSSTRDTAAEVIVRAGQESAGVDIRYREEQAHRVTGRIEFSSPPTDGSNATGLTLSYASSGLMAGVTYVNPLAPDASFSFDAIADGDYDLQATIGGRDGLTSAATPQRVTVRGADVTGLRVRLTPLASASGTILVERASEAARARAECKDATASLPPQETLVTATSDRPASARGEPPSRISPSRETTPDAAGAFTLRSLEAGRYRLAVRPFDENLYVRSIELPAATSNTQRAASAARPSAPAQTANAQTANAQTQAAPARGVLDLRASQQLSGITVRLTEGAASISGHVVAAEGAQTPPYASLRVHLLPAEREHSDDPLRFFETTPGSDGSFSFKNLPPGRYLLLARPSADTTDATPRPAAWDSASRAKLRADAEAANTTVELQPCQRTTDFTLRFPPPAPK
jgi:protocatechuate 3,4-dioxygenase beta subunit